MVFCSVELAARIERAESSLLADACAHVAHRLPELFAQPLAGGFAAFTEPGSPLNKISGLGFAETFDRDAFLAVEAEHRRRGAPMQIELATLGDPSIAPFLCERGYALVGVENVLGCPLPRPAPTAALGLRITESPASELPVWLATIVDGFAAADSQGVAAHEEFDRAVLERIVADFAQARGITRYLARRDDTPIGAGSMRMSDGIAQLCGAATLPSHRRQGVQSTLLDWRLAAAGANGCSLAVVTTQPGSKSQENVQKRGFALLYARNVLRREFG